jgi:KipI family sensor histidine kinase inhibitor
MTTPRLFPYGQDAVYIDLDLDHSSDRVLRTHTTASILRERFPLADILVGGGVLVAVGHLRIEDVAEVVAETSIHAPMESSSSKRHIIPIVFDGPDLDDVSATSGLTRDEIEKCLTTSDLAVDLIGFLPGFGYLGPLDSRLVLPRRSAPRPRVPAGSLAIAGGFAGIYPFPSPGGWHLLGRAVGVTLFDADRENPILFAPGDLVRFEALAATNAPHVEPAKPIGKNVANGDHQAFVVEVAPACATIQDAGRQGQLHRGMPPSGPLDPDTFTAANLAVGNEPGEAAIEIPLGRLLLRFLRDVVVSLDGDKPISVANGEKLEISENSRAVRYLAIRGGLDVPLVLGSRSTLLVARMGGFSGRPLRKGDRLGIADRVARDESSISCALPENEDVVEIVFDAGPHIDRFPAHALDVFVASTYRVSTLADRVGVRLDGDKIPRMGGDSALPVPMIRGAVQISTDGTPIVFGPDHPATGGYPVLAVVRRLSWSGLARQRAGKSVRFVLGR